MGEFVIFPNNSSQSNITIDVRHPGSHDPGCHGETGGQHRPTGPDTALRYSGEKDNSDTSGSIREAPLGTVSGSLVVSDPLGNIVDKPGNVVTQFPWSGLEQDTLQAVMPRSVSALKMGDASRLDRDSQSTSSQSPGLLCYIVKVMGQGQSRSKLCEGQPFCYSALRCCLVVF